VITSTADISNFAVISFRLKEIPPLSHQRQGRSLFYDLVEKTSQRIRKVKVSPSSPARRQIYDKIPVKSEGSKAWNCGLQEHQS
jgi:hypothetical protein